MSQNNTFHFRLVSPESEIVNAPATFVTLPGTEGDMGVYAGHMPIISGLKSGVIEVTFADTARADERYTIENGFVDMSPTACTIVAEAVRPV